MISRHTPSWIWPVFLALTALSGLYFLTLLARLPSDSGQFLFGLSAARLAILLPMALLILGFGGLAAVLALHPRLRPGWERQMRRGPLLLGALIISGGFLLGPLTLVDLLRTLFHDSADFRYSAYAARLAPPADWLALVGLLLLAVVVLFYRAELLSLLGDEARPFRRWGWIWLGLGLLGLLAGRTGIGFSGDTLGSWGLPTVPLLEWQIGLALLVSLAAALLLARLHPRLPAGRLDLMISLLIWGIAALIWAGHPLVPGYFATPGRAPNFEIYPFSDGQTYDQYAQSILIGNGLMGAIPQRPLYIVFLALLHVIAGQDYLKVIFVQQLILAVFPVLLYWIGKELHNRPAGILAALLVILREVTAIRVAPFTDNISYSKLYFSELPTAVCLSAFTLFALRWALGRSRKTGQRWSLDALLAGGFLGMAMLIRTQSLAVLPLVLLVALLMALPDWRGWLRGALLVGMGIGVCVLPWLARNEAIAGGIAFDNADSQTLVLAQRYNNLTFDAPIPRQPGEKEAHYSARLVQMALAGMARDPATAAWYVANHWMNNEISNVLIFPLRFNISRPAELLWPDAPFWQAWSGRLTPAQGLLMLANLGLLAAGLAGAVRRAGAAGWIPLLVNLAYNLSTAIFRSSGGRFLLPVDWTALLLYALGWAQLFLWAWKLAGKTIPAVWTDPWGFIAAPHPLYQPVDNRKQLVPLLGVGLIFLVVGLSLPLAEHVFPQRYPPQTPAQLSAALFSALSNQAPGKVAALRQLSQQPGAVLLRGRALYPRFYRLGQSEPKTAKIGYAGLPFARLVFYLVGSQNGLVVLPLEQSPEVFPNTADVLLLGCADQGYIRAAAVVVEGPGAAAAYVASGPVCAP